MRRLPVLAAVLTVAALTGCAADTRAGSGSSAPSSAPTPSLTTTAPTTASTTTQENQQIRITVSVGGTTLTGTLHDNAASLDLFARLPIEIAMTDHGGVEKTGPLPAPLSLDGFPAARTPRSATSATTPRVRTSSSTTATRPTTKESWCWAASTTASKSWRMSEETFASS